MLNLKYKQKYLKYKNKYLHIKSQIGGSISQVLALTLSILLGPPQAPHAVLLRELRDERVNDIVLSRILEELMNNPPQTNNAKRLIFSNIIAWVHALPQVQLEENMNYLRRTIYQINQTGPDTQVESNSLISMVILLAMLLTSNQVADDDLLTNMRQLLAQHVLTHRWLQPLTNMLLNLNVAILTNSFEELLINLRH